VNNKYRPNQPQNEPQEDIKISNGRLSIRVSDRSLISILHRLSELQRDVTILVKDRRIDRQVTANFEAAPLDLALRALLNDEDVVMLYGAGQPVLEAVIVYPRGQGYSVVWSESRQEGDSNEQLMRKLDSPDEKERGRAVQSLIERLGTESQDIVLRALEDQSGHVRQQALDGALKFALPLPVDNLIGLATTDPVPSVRTYAMEALADNLKGTDAQERLTAIVEAAERDRETNGTEEADRLSEQPDE
jgi:HEAT repeats